MTEKTTNNSLELINAIQIYFDAIHYCDVQKLNAIFHDKSSLFDVDKGNVFVESIASFSKDVADRISPASKNQKPEYEILMIDMLSSSCATVKIRIRAHENIFVDHLGFVNGENGWQIVSKIWHLEQIINK